MYYKPVSDWTGELILPSLSERRDDGGVFLKITNAPKEYEKLRNRTIWLFWDSDWNDEIKFDMSFSKDALKAQKLNYNVPFRVKDWQKVSALESIAAAYPEGELQVRLVEPEILLDQEVEENTIAKVAQTPVLIAGSQIALVKFIGSCSDNTIEVCHYNIDTKAFDGYKERMKTLPINNISNCPIKLASLINIEKSPLNEFGWYVYGDKLANGNFLIKAIEPRTLNNISIKAIQKSSYDNSETFVEETWSKQTFKKQKADRFLGNNFLDNLSDSTIKDSVGKQFFVIYSSYDGIPEPKYFLPYMRWRLGYQMNLMLKIGVITNAGHLSLGHAQMERDPFTTESRLKITYKQVQIHGYLQKLCADQDWHVYNGLLKNGNMFWTSVADIVIEFPEIFSTETDGCVFSTLSKSIDKLNFCYRQGYGTGLVKGSFLHNCLRGTQWGLINSLEKLKLGTFFEEFKRLIFKNGTTPNIWEKPVQTIPPKGLAQEYLDSREFKSSFPSPRKALYEIVNLFFKYKKGILINRYSFIGGEISELYPRKRSN